MMWFSINTLYEYVVEGESDNLWEEIIEVILADSEDKAKARIEKIGHSREHSYEGGNGDDVNVKYRGIERIFFIEDQKIESGTEVFTRFLKASEVKSILEKFD